MSLPTIFELCQPRDNVFRGAIQEADYPADLAQVLRGEAPEEPAWAHEAAGMAGGTTL
jgi:hypothetical protein